MDRMHLSKRVPSAADFPNEMSIIARCERSKASKEFKCGSVTGSMGESFLFFMTTLLFPLCLPCFLFFQCFLRFFLSLRMRWKSIGGASSASSTMTEMFVMKADKNIQSTSTERRLLERRELNIFVDHVEIMTRNSATLMEMQLGRDWR